jgi:hypothetical protein
MMNYKSENNYLLKLCYSKIIVIEMYSNNFKICLFKIISLKLSLET